MSNRGSIRCWIGFHDIEWTDYTCWFRLGHCRRCGKFGYGVRDE